MRQHPLYRVAVGLALALGLAAAAAAADPAAKDDAGNKRLLYIVKHGSAKDLAAVLGAHFKGAAEVQALPDATSNTLLISAGPAAFDEVVKLLEQLDRPPQTVAVDILIVTLGKKAEGETAAPPPRPRPGGGRFRPQPAQILPDYVQDALGLTADQKKQVEALQQESDARLDKILTDEQKQQLRPMRERGPGAGAGFDAAPAAGASEDVDEKDFSGSIADIDARVEALQKKGGASVKRLRLTAVEGQQVSVTMGESLPYVVGVNHTATGQTSRNFSYRNAGLKADCTVRVSPDKVVSLDLKLEESHPYVPEDGIQIGADENGKPILATEFAQTTLNSKLDIPSGKAQAAVGVKTSAKAEKPHVLVIVGARVVEPDARPEK
jgi:hypothetical protein